MREKRMGNENGRKDGELGCMCERVLLCVVVLFMWYEINPIIKAKAVIMTNVVNSRD